MSVDAVVSAPMARLNPTRRRVAGLQLKAARKAKGLSQEQVARELDCRLATISDRETSRDVSWETWLAWAMAIGLTREEAQTPPEPWVEPETSRRPTGPDDAG